MKKVLVIDAQGGGIGKQLITEIVARNLSVEIVAVGSNSAATSVMLKAGAEHAATGENAVKVGCRTADFVMGPVGIAIADSMYGEITPDMACAVGQSIGQKIFIPVNHCSNYVVGVSNLNLKTLIKEAVDFLEESLKK
ncbi:MAG: DUF3842 family protein [Lachnospiraceae bacterium]|nr:DUF3842 family protein [Lachnospiraceae bacterium]